jgi:hypothetical protein
MSRKLHVIAAAVLAVTAITGAQALTIVGNSPTTLASEVLPASGTTNVKLNNIGFNSTSQGVVAGNNYTLKLTLSAGKWAAPTGATKIFHQDPSQAAAGNTQVFNIISGVGTNVLVVAPTGAATAGPVPAASSVVGAGAPAAFSSTAANTLFQINGASVDITSADLIASGVNDDGCAITFKNLTITGQYLDNNSNEVDLPVGGLNTATIITAGQGIVGAIAAPATAPVVDIVGSSGKKFIRGTTVVTTAAIGTYKFADAAGTQSDNAAVPADYNAANALWNDNGQTINLNASAGLASNASFTIRQLATLPAGVTVASGGTCDSPVIVGSDAANYAEVGNYPVPAANTTVTANGSGSDIKLAIPAATANVTTAGAAGKNLLICYNVVGGATDTVIPLSKFTGYASSNRAAAAPLSDFAAGKTCPANLANVGINGGMIKVRNYSPASVNAFGWNQFTRIINSGTVATEIKGYYQYADGTTSTPASLVTSLPAGGNVTMLNTEVETKLGAPSAVTGANGKASNPRLVITSNSDGIRVQNYQMTPDSQRWMEVSGGQADAPTDTTAQ